MNKLSAQFLDIGYSDTLAGGNSFLHRLDPRAKLIATLAFIVTVVSFDKYAVSGLIPFCVFPITLIALGGLPAGYLLKKVLLVSPFAILVAVFNPLIDRQVLVRFGSLAISGGWVSFISIFLRFVLTVTAALVLIALTGFNQVCLAMAKFGMPRPFVVQLLFFFRYLFVLSEEAQRMLRARQLRSFDRRAMQWGTFVSLAGHLLVRTLDRAERIYLAMCSRGFDGRIRILRRMKIGLPETVFVLGWVLVFVFMRFYNVPSHLGALITGRLS
ncbi:MAG TPA: cobalt ECF transporter T component CbiQ [Candidatus Omnitrophota bacterium]|nr:cobalt ECF transporter T component CbiQ [Candidatus Omnitrophota bacterium]